MVFCLVSFSSDLEFILSDFFSSSSRLLLEITDLSFSNISDSEAYLSCFLIKSQAFSCFGQQLLTDKEQQIACLLLQGFDSEDIAQQLHISTGTVKNHRKKIYAKLQIGSLSELFQLFLTHLLAS